MIIVSRLLYCRSAVLYTCEWSLFAQSMQTVLEQGSIDKPLTFDVGFIQLSFIPVCSLNTCNISVKLCGGFALQCFSLLWLHSLSGVIRSLLCKPRAFSPAITRTWNTWSRTESACVESTTRHYNRDTRGPWPPRQIIDACGYEEMFIALALRT